MGDAGAAGAFATGEEKDGTMRAEAQDSQDGQRDLKDLTSPDALSEELFICDADFFCLHQVVAVSH